MTKAMLSHAPRPVTMTRTSSKPHFSSLPDRGFFFATSSSRPVPPLPGVARGHRVPGDSTKSLQFLDSCGTCGRGLSASRDIYIYKGDIAFCSQDCREQRMQWDL